MYRGLTVAVAIPAYRAEATIAQVVSTLPDLVDRVIAVDDASPDGSVEAARALAAGDSRVRVHENEVNKGHIETMVKLGVFDSLEPNRRVLERRLAFDALPAAQQCVAHGQCGVGAGRDDDQQRNSDKRP